MASLTVINPQVRSDQLPRTLNGRIEAVYIHIPFCFHKCHYCDFYSITRQTPERMERFVDLTLLEAKRWAQAMDIRPRTVFFGGGTPSLLAVEQMRRLLEGLKQRFDFSALEEWTIECNPATVDEAYLRTLRESGVNRLSFGAQSFDRNELATLERHHNPDDIQAVLAMARSAGFERINFDLIYAIPGQSLVSWENSLQTAIDLKTTHLSCYGLTYEPNTPMAVKKRLGVIQATEENLELEMFRVTRQRLHDAGLQAYEISNFATPGEECRHNLVYWLGGNYIGLGPSAASHVEGHRWRNRPHLGEWESAIHTDGQAVCDVETLSPDHRARELAMLMLRLSRGIEFDHFHQRAGKTPVQFFAPTIDRLAKLNLIEITPTAIRLTESGLPVADAVAAEFLSDNA